MAFGAATLIGTVQYFVAEYVASAAWHAPPYDFLSNYISDLGVPGCGKPAGASPICSPLAPVMNTGLVLSGLLAITATLSLVPLVPRVWTRRAVTALAGLHGVGSILVGLVHSAPGTVAGTPRLHLAAAYLAVLGGNMALLSLAAGLDRAAATIVRALLATLGATGLLGGLLLVVRPAHLPGFFERLAVDPIPIAEVALGVTLAVALARRPPAVLPVSPRRSSGIPDSRPRASFPSRRRDWPGAT